MAHSSPSDQAATLSSLHFFRSLGSEVGLALCGAIIQLVLSEKLPSALGRSRSEGGIEGFVNGIRKSLDFIHTLPESQQEVVRRCYSLAIQAAFAVCAGLAGVAAVVVAAGIGGRDLTGEG